MSKTSQYCPELKKFELFDGVADRIEKQVAKMTPSQQSYFGPHFIKNGKKYYYKKITDQEVTSLWADPKGIFQPEKCRVFKPVAGGSASSSDKK